MGCIVCVVGADVAPFIAALVAFLVATDGGVAGKAKAAERRAKGIGRKLVKGDDDALEEMEAALEDAFTVAAPPPQVQPHHAPVRQSASSGFVPLAAVPSDALQDEFKNFNLAFAAGIL